MEIPGSKSYQESLSVNAKVSVETGFIAKKKFSLSTDYKDMKKSTSSNFKVLVRTSAECYNYFATVETSAKVRHMINTVIN